MQRKINAFVIANPGKVSDACEVDLCFSFTRASEYGIKISVGVM